MDVDLYLEHTRNQAEWVYMMIRKEESDGGYGSDEFDESGGLMRSVMIVGFVVHIAFTAFVVGWLSQIGDISQANSGDTIRQFWDRWQ
jgi:hypothetical protein